MLGVNQFSSSSSIYRQSYNRMYLPAEHFLDPMFMFNAIGRYNSIQSSIVVAGMKVFNIAYDKKTFCLNFCK